MLCELVAGPEPTPEQFEEAARFQGWLDASRQEHHHPLDTWGIFLHYLLTGQADGGLAPESFLGDRLWGTEAPGGPGTHWPYDPAIVYDTDQVAEITEALELSLRDEQRVQRLCRSEPLTREGVYPFVGWTEVEVTWNPWDGDLVSGGHLSVYESSPGRLVLRGSTATVPFYSYSLAVGRDFGDTHGVPYTIQVRVP